MNEVHDDDELEEAFFRQGVEPADDPRWRDPVLERKRSPVVAARRARLSGYVKVVVAGAAALCLVAAHSHMAAREGHAAKVLQARASPAEAVGGQLGEQAGVGDQNVPTAVTP